MNGTAQRELLQTFVRLADTLVDDYDVVELLQVLVDSCRDLLETTAAGILLANPRGELEVVASTSEASRLVEVMQLSAEAGPCIDSFRSGRRVSVPDIAHSQDSWVQFRGAAMAQGFRAMDALPMRLRDTTIGTLNLLRSAPGVPDEDDILAAQAFADVATIGILHERSVKESSVLSRQLQAALNSRIVIEQAKGVVSQTRGVSIDEAFLIIRQYARSHSVGLSTVAARLVDRSLHL